MKSELIKRDYLFDNLKAMLIFLVILGHFIEIGLYNNPIYKGIWCAIYLFHMPLFIFISGYFTKYNEENPKKAIKNYLIPYLITDSLLIIFRKVILKENITTFYLLTPQYAIWFLLSMFWYKFLYNGIYRIKGVLFISIILSILIGLDKNVTSFLSLSRTIVFMPFFIAGTKFKKEYLITRMKYGKYIKILLIILLPILLIISGYVCVKANVPLDLLRCSKPYKTIGLSAQRGMIERSIILILGFVISYMFLNIMSEKKLFFSYIGKNTIVIYITHIFLIIYCMKNKILCETTYKTFILSFIIATLYVFIVGMSIFKKVYDFILDKITKKIYL